MESEQKANTEIDLGNGYTVDYGGIDPISDDVQRSMEPGKAGRPAGRRNIIRSNHVSHHIRRYLKLSPMKLQETATVSIASQIAKQILKMASEGDKHSIDIVMEVDKMPVEDLRTKEQGKQVIRMDAEIESKAGDVLRSLGIGPDDDLGGNV